MNIEVNGVKITLTKEQLSEISKQTCKFKSYTDIKSFEDACNYLNISTEIPIGVTYSDSHIAKYKLEIITQAINKLTNFEIDWDNECQRKYYPYFKMGKNFGFCSVDYDYWISGCRVGSRVCFKDEEIARYMGTQFEDTYKTWLNK